MRKKPWPVLRTDEEAEAFVATTDLTEYDFSDFEPASFRFETETVDFSIQLPQSLRDAVNAAAARAGLSDQDFVRQVLETAARTDRDAAPVR